MILRIILVFTSIFIAASCKCQNSDHLATIEKPDSISKGMTHAKLNGIQAEGKFLKIEKSGDRYFNLFLRLDNDSIEIFKTLMPLDENEIKLLKKNVNNIKITYKEYNNPVTKKLDKIVQYMQPVYDL